MEHSPCYTRQHLRGCGLQHLWGCDLKLCLFPGPVCHLVPVELCWEGQQAAFEAAGKVQQVHATARSSAMENGWQLPGKGGCELSRKGKTQHPCSLGALWD